MIQYNQLLNQNQPTIHQQHFQKINFSLFNTHISIQMVKFHFNFLINFNFYFTINSQMIFPQNMSFISNYFLQTSLIIHFEAQYSSILFTSFTSSSFFNILIPQMRLFQLLLYERHQLIQFQILTISNGELLPYSFHQCSNIVNNQPIFEYFETKV
ncbi:unnamed protein product [Paramecium pentaurelia]|uniref:Uncharacterized protein n=1 Tax=Paramecium pentaurelia TaxID=43138 RepID=A0A8S1WBT8_9CILI|nr:unnamed protein product [Paramecium pentaurelia]